MKKLLIVTIPIYIGMVLLAGCDKNCKTCTWTAKAPGYKYKTYTAKEKQYCDGDWKEQDGKVEYVIDGGGNRVLANCHCD